jgi:NAD(P)-dependent dehydrogenase (short-subunit alcohol dehydrogenase family)
VTTDAAGSGPFAGKVALVTGASSGLGLHFAGLLAAGGARHVFLAGRRMDRLSAVAADLSDRHAPATPLLLDVTAEASVADALDRVRETAGRLDILVNNAGIADTAPALDTPADSFDRVMATNLRGCWLTAVASARLMREGGGGDIVNIASILGLRVATNVAPYAMSKAALVQMTKALALEWARHGIRVNALCPGYVRTEINAGFFDTEAGQAMVRRIPMRRLGELADLEAPFTLLASGASRILTGAVLTVDGGHSVSSL